MKLGHASCVQNAAPDVIPSRLNPSLCTLKPDLCALETAKAQQLQAQIPSQGADVNNPPQMALIAAAIKVEDAQDKVQDAAQQSVDEVKTQAATKAQESVNATQELKDKVEAVKELKAQAEAKATEGIDAAQDAKDQAEAAKEKAAANAQEGVEAAEEAQEGVVDGVSSGQDA